MTVQAFATGGTGRIERGAGFGVASRSLSAVPVQRLHASGPSALPAAVSVRVMGTDPLSREGVLHLLLEYPDIQVIPEQTPGPTDLVIVVVDRLGDGTVRMLRMLRMESGPRIVVVVGELDTRRVSDILQAGTAGILRRHDVTRLGLRRLLRSVVAGEVVVPPDVMSAVLARPAVPAGAARPAPGDLNDRERKVIRMLADGSDTREISHTLCYSERTVKTIIQEITQRFGLRNRSHAVAYAIRQGLI